MNQKSLYILCLLIFTLGCSDFLDVEPDLQVSYNEQLSTREGVLEAYNGVYRDLEDVFSSTYLIYPEVLGGNLTFTPSVTRNMVDIPIAIENTYNFNSNPDEMDYQEYYQDLYDVINQVNLLLENKDNMPFFDSNELSQLEAELLSIRAIAHYQVSLLFAQNINFTTDGSHLGVIYNTNQLTAGEDFPSRLSMVQTNEQIASDLDTALSVYTSAQLLGGPDYSYFNTQTTTAFYARIALQMNDWEKAQSLAETIIDISGVELMDTANYISEWEQPELPVSEVIFELTAPRSSEGNISSTVSQYFQYSSPTNYGNYVASGDLLDFYEDNDIRKELFLIQNLNQLVNGELLSEEFYFTKKFQNDAGTTIIRLSEMYLIHAEASARLGQNGKALESLNAIRERANLEPLMEETQILEEIFMERRRELAFEGHLFFDSLRFKRDIVRDQGCISNNCNLSYPSDFMILPIPASSIDLNENIQQNEGY